MHRKVKANVSSLRSAVVEAQADFYASDEVERILVGETVTSLIERLHTAEAELDRIEGAMDDYKRAEFQAETWLEVSEDYAIRFGEKPDTETLLRLFTELDITGSIRTQDEVEALVERFTKKDWENLRFTIPLVPWLKVTALSIDPLLSTGGGAVPPCP